MGKLFRSVVVVVALICFGAATLAIAAEFYVVKDASGKMSVADKKPADAKSVVKGPLPTKEDAEKAMKAASAKPAKLPDEGC
ncbi:MAG: hypothetical protein HY912_18600 [Desulfomonile tiedjei]|uniref:Uncharacterized protein n=1 Tax=Desulfomonile tiedjei TaxID=2358 RepID=A0A9D6Z4Y3_9BACT|nr:hypothetical protein [Desulfomonile tiedjei]